MVSPLLVIMLPLDIGSWADAEAGRLLTLSLWEDVLSLAEDWEEGILLSAGELEDELSGVLPVLLAEELTGALEDELLVMLPDVLFVQADSISTDALKIADNKICFLVFIFSLL